MRFKCEIRHIAKTCGITFFYINPIFFLFRNGMTQVTDKIKIYIPFFDYDAVQMIVQFFKRGFRSDKFAHNIVQIFFRNQPVFPFLCMNILGFNNHTVFNNNSSCVIAPYVILLWGKVNCNNIIFCYNSFARNIVSAGN